jgi:hypothetical protein
MRTKKKFLIVLHDTEGLTEVKLVSPRKETDDNDEALRMKAPDDHTFASIAEAFLYISQNKVEITGEFIGLIY